MDFSRGLLIPEEKQKQQNQNRPWIPITPSKLITTTREESDSVYTQGNQPGTTTNFLRQAVFDQGFYSEIPNSNGILENFNSVSSMDHRDFLSNNWEAATTAAALGSNNRGDLGSDKAAWNNLACSDLLALAEAASGASKASVSGSDRGNNNAASTSSVPVSCSQIPTNLQQPDLSCMLFQNQNISVSSSMLNNNSQLQLPHYGYPGSYIPSYDLNSLPNLNDALLDGFMSPYQFEPFTPDHSKRLKKSIQVSETVNACLDEQTIQGNNMQQEAVGLTGNVVPELISNQPTSAPVDSLNAGLSTLMNKNFEAVKGGDNGIDLNTPPQRQKAKRKKYTPKVVREGKPKSTPKPKTPKQASTTENSTGRMKRKYVRKTGPKASETPSVECVKDTDNSTSESAARSCKRSFNFDSDSRARDESQGTILDLQKHLPSWNVNRSSYMWDLNSNSGIQAKDVHTGDNSDSPTKSPLQGTQGWEVIVENSRAQTAFDLNHYSTQKQCISLPEQSSSELSQPTETELKREYLKVHSREINVTRTADECVSSAEIGCPPTPQQIHTEEAECIALPTKIARHGLQSMSTRRTDSSNGSNGTEQARGSKREYGNMSNTSQLCSLNLLGAQFNSLQAYHEILIHKKKRTEKVHNTVASSLLSPNKAVEVGSNARQTMSRRPSDPNSIYFPSQVKYPQSAPRSNNTIGTTYTRNNISKSGSNLRPQSMPVGHNPQVQNSSAVISLVEALRGATLDKLPEFMLSNRETGWRTKRRSKGSTWARNSASLSALFQCNKMPSSPPETEHKQANGKQVLISDGPLACIEALAAGTHAKLTKKKRSRKGVAMARSASYSCAKELGLHEHDAASYEYRQSFAKYRGISLAQKITGTISSSRSSHSLSINATFERQSHKTHNRDSGGKFHAGPSKVTNDYLVTIHNYLIAVDELVKKFRCLSIDSSDRINVQEQNAMVLFGKVDTMVPYVGPFDLIKRRKPRAKVDLDPETDRVWRSLMGKECRLSIEGTGEDKEKWWEEERRIFRGRADSFIARMHLVLGDRRFTQWKGSVVDSVIGVFLTQNVSDHLSSSAFMSLAARFPLQSSSNHYYEQRTEVIVEEPEGDIRDADDSGQWHEKMSTESVCDQGYIPLDEVEHIAEREAAECIDSFGSNKGGCRTPDNSKGKQSAFCKSGLDNLTTETEKSCSVDSEDRTAVQDVVSSQNSVGSSENSACSSILQTSGDRSLTLTRISTCLVEDRNSRALEDVVSSQNCDTSILQTAERSCSDSNSEAEDVMTGCKSNSYDCSTSFTRLLHMAGTSKLQEYYSHGQESFSPEKKLDCGSTQSESTGSERSSLEGLDYLRDSFHSIHPSNSKLPHQGLFIPSNNYHLQKTPDLARLEIQCLEVSAEQTKLSSISTASEITDRRGMDSVNKQNCLMEETASETTVLSVQAADLVTSLSKHSAQTLCSSGQEAEFEKHLHSCNNFEVEQSGTLQTKSTPSKESENLVEELAPRSNELQQGSSSLPEFPIENMHVEETRCLMTQKTHTDNKDMASNLGERVLPSDNETAVNTLKDNGKPGKEKKPEFDWDSLRKDAYLKGTKRERTRSTMDTLDYEALRCANVSEIAAAIKERGMNNMLAERIKDFLNRLVRDHESIDLEWLKDVPPDKAKEFLLSIRGLGLKSVECVRLLTLHQLAFPVDVNVGRIAVRLGWVPLQPLPESLQLHLLELYPMQETIRKYLWPRLCTLDQRTLYELHYQMITFGKVFCTKSKPNCNACPLRAECRHFASAFASARLALPAPEEKGMVPSAAPIVGNKFSSVNTRPMRITLPETNIVSESRSNGCEPIIEEPEITLVSETISGTNDCKPIIEEPASPEIRTIEISEKDMEDAFNEDPDEIPTINVSMMELTTTVTNLLQENNMDLHVEEMSKALIALTPEAASIPTPKLKNVGRLRTEHEVYVLPDSHPLLVGLDKREPDDPSAYLLAIWTPGETPESTEPPKICCGSHESGNLCNEKICFPCNSVREAKSQIVRGTILIPCKTAMRGSFPLNGTYFQVNEVFADHDSSQCPINVPRQWLWNLPRRTVFFGTSVISIFKGLATEVIQSCFWKGFVCVRGFDRTTRSPRPLKSRLHYTATRLKQEEEARKKQ